MLVDPDHESVGRVVVVVVGYWDVGKTCTDGGGGRE